MKVLIDSDEWYPVYSIETNPAYFFGAPLVEIDESLLKRYENAKQEFEAVQLVLEELYK